MAMSYQPKFPQLREKIGVYGETTVGKTNCAITMMRRMTDRHFHIFDNDASYELAIYEDEDRNKKIIDAQNFTIHTPDFTDYTEQVKALREIADNIEAGDWGVFDLMDPLWESMPSWYTTTFLGLDEQAYMIEVRRALEEQRRAATSKADQKGGAALFDRLRDYTYMNHVYFKDVYAVFDEINRKGAHVLCMAGSKIVKDGDDKETRKRYSQFGARPASQKGLTKKMNTMLYLTWDGDETWEMSTAKDRASRLTDDKKLDEQEWTDFCAAYLSPVARWSMQKVD